MLKLLVACVAIIVIVSELIGKSPVVVLTGLGAGTAILMLVFQDTIKGLVAGVQLTANDMLRPGDWISVPKYGADGDVIEVTLTTVKVRNWDNTLSMIPPYTLVSSPFINWRGMMESGGRRVDKKIYLDICSVEVLKADNIREICSRMPVLNDYEILDSMEIPNSQLYRIYIERYLRNNPLVAQNLDLIVAQRQPSEYGLPIEVYFFLKDKTWANYEKNHSDIFDHLLVVSSLFGLRVYQKL
jgi:miniconductance mechanosensitive channel